MNPFVEDYYERGEEKGLSLYTSYRWLPSLTVPMAGALTRELGIMKPETIMDYGCAKGYLVKALRILGFTAFGWDISEYAVNAADDDTRNFLYTPPSSRGSTDWTLAKDVLEHMTEEETLAALRDIRANSGRLFVAVPLGSGNAYTIPDMEKDVTHKIRQPLWWWTGLVEEAGFKVVSAEFSMKGVKENWTRRWPMGNGFISAR